MPRRKEEDAEDPGLHKVRLSCTNIGQTEESISKGSHLPNGEERQENLDKSCSQTIQNDIDAARGFGDVLHSPAAKPMHQPLPPAVRHEERWPTAPSPPSDLPFQKSQEVHGLNFGPKNCSKKSSILPGAPGAKTPVSPPHNTYRQRLARFLHSREDSSEEEESNSLDAEDQPGAIPVGGCFRSPDDAGVGFGGTSNDTMQRGQQPQSAANDNNDLIAIVAHTVEDPVMGSVINLAAERRKTRLQIFVGAVILTIVILAVAVPISVLLPIEKPPAPTTAPTKIAPTQNPTSSTGAPTQNPSAQTSIAETDMERAKRLIVGTWEGNNTSIWAILWVQVEFTPEGVVHPKCLSSDCSTAFYYGSDTPSVTRRYELNDLRADGFAKGWIEVGWSHNGGITRGTLDAVNFSLDGQELRFEFMPTWQDGGMGRIFSFTLFRQQ